jgi:hypothetical protein
VSYVFQPWTDSPADGDGRFVGFKVAIYNMQLNGETVVKMESYVDPNNNQWQKVYDFIDQVDGAAKVTNAMETLIRSLLGEDQSLRSDGMTEIA